MYLPPCRIFRYANAPNRLLWTSKLKSYRDGSRHCDLSDQKAIHGDSSALKATIGCMNCATSYPTQWNLKYFHGAATRYWKQFTAQRRNIFFFCVLYVGLNTCRFRFHVSTILHRDWKIFSPQCFRRANGHAILRHIYHVLYTPRASPVWPVSSVSATVILIQSRT